MKRNIGIASLLVVGVVGGVLANKAYVRATITDLYVKKGSAPADCIRLVTTSPAPFASPLSNSIGGQQATIKSNGGNHYPLFQDNGCSTTPVYLQ